MEMAVALALVLLLFGTEVTGVHSIHLPSIAVLAARHIAALGGRERIDAIKTLSFRGEWLEGGQSLPMSSYRMRPYYFLVAPKLDPAYLEGYDGRSWEYYGQYGVVLRTAGAPGSATLRASEFDDPLVDYAATGKRLAIKGVTSIAGVAVYDVLVVLADDSQKHLYVDVGNSLIVGSRQVAKVHAFGAAVTTQEILGGYRRIGGVLIATKSKDFDLRTGREIDRLTWKTIAVNENFALAMFSPPAVVRAHTPLARLLELLYADRENALACSSAYRAFRLTFGAATSMEDGIEFIGYQMLKAGSKAAPIALLKANAANYPRSAAAEFGLGRAYEAAGDVAAARAAYHLALRLSPAYSPATQALQHLGPLSRVSSDDDL
jgi:hypothetical protein